MKSRAISFCNFVLVLMMGFLAVSCNGWEYRNDKKTKRIVLGAGEVHEGWYFAAGDQVVIEGTINGDAYVAGGVVDVEGTINGDLLVAGGMVTVGGTVSDDVRAAGGTVQFVGKVGKNISAAAGSIMVGRSGDVQGNILAACGNFEATGNVGKEARIMSGEAEINGSIGGNIDFAGNYLTIPQGASVGGNVNAKVRDKEKVKITDGTVHGKVDVVIKESRGRSEILGLPAWRFWLKIVWFFGLLVVGLLFALAAPLQLRKMGAVIISRFGETAIWGIMGMIVIPVLSVVFCVTIIGIPAGLLLFSAFLWLVYFSQFALGIVIAEKVFTLDGKGRFVLFGALAIGMAVVEVLSFVPYLAVLLYLASFILGIGAILLVLRDVWQSFRKV